MIAWLDHRLAFPPVERALREPDGLLAAGGDLSLARLLSAYRQGIFPWYNPGEPILWWSPDPRMVLLPAQLHVPRSLAKVLRQGHYEIRFDTAFAEVMSGCAAPRRDTAGTWINPQLSQAYLELHHAGYAHSAECWYQGELVGGLYGVAIGQVFYGESMFAARADASKCAFVHLVRWLQANQFALIDCQMHTAHLARFGAGLMPRAQFQALLAQHCAAPGRPGRWHYLARGEPDAGIAS